MAVRRTVTKPGLYFITFTCYNWLPLIELSDSYDAVYKWFDYLKTKTHSITGYVVMPNHLHGLLYFAGGSASLNKVIGNAKRFLAYEIVERLGQQGRTDLLQVLHLAVDAKDRECGRTPLNARSAAPASSLCRSYPISTAIPVRGSGTWPRMRAPTRILRPRFTSTESMWRIG